MTYDPMEDIAEEGSLQEEAAQIISQLIAWHGGRVETLKQTADVKVIKLVGKLPISISE